MAGIDFLIASQHFPPCSQSFAHLTHLAPTRVLLVLRFVSKLTSSVRNFRIWRPPSVSESKCSGHFTSLVIWPVCQWFLNHRLSTQIATKHAKQVSRTASATRQNSDRYRVLSMRHCPFAFSIIVCSPSLFDLRRLFHTPIPLHRIFFPQTSRS
jgi:hypothetical protein